MRFLQTFINNNHYSTKIIMKFLKHSKKLFFFFCFLNECIFIYSFVVLFTLWFFFFYWITWCVRLFVFDCFENRSEWNSRGDWNWSSRKMIWGWSWSPHIILFYIYTAHRKRVRDFDLSFCFLFILSTVFCMM